MIRRAGKVGKGDIILFHNDSQYLLDALPTLFPDISRNDNNCIR